MIITAIEKILYNIITTKSTLREKQIQLYQIIRFRDQNKFLNKKIEKNGQV